jgi:hypothetical protein
MRKVFWCCVAAAVAAAGTVYLAAKHVDQHPYAVMSQAVVSFCGKMGPTGAPVAPEPSNGLVPAEPAPVEMTPTGAATPKGESASPVVAISGPELVGHIDLSTCQPSDVCATIDYPATVDAQCLPAAGKPTPEAMPYCSDDATAPRQMPYAEEKKTGEDVSCTQSEEFDYCPAVVGTEETCEENSCPWHCGWSVFRHVWNLLQSSQIDSDPADVSEEGTSEAESSTDDAIDHEYHDYHHGCHGQQQYCPYTGRCYPSMNPSPAVPDVPATEKKDQTEEAPKKSPNATMPPAPEEQENGALLPPPRIDTMECRPSDAGLDGLIPRL